MKFELTEEEVRLLAVQDVSFDPDYDYTDDEALDFMDRVRDIEVKYAEDYDPAGERLFFLYGDLADKVQAQIPED